IEILVFAGIVFVSLLYLVSNGALTWGPAKKLEGAMPARTSESTIARISGIPDPLAPLGNRPAAAVAADSRPASTDPARPTGPGQAA
ncbi:MAG: hypothetical protein QOJ44_1287, partial [Acidimicrobiaceae bacterium]|nr:hypothetical protein [Acidimicrobiaceae bacterium]